MITLEKMLASSLHLGHKVKQWNPKMKMYIYGERKGIHIIDLLQTLVCLKKVCNFLIRSTKKGKKFKVLFVCTKRYFSTLTKMAAINSHSFFVTERWLGGTLTNWVTIKSCINKLKVLNSKQSAKKNTKSLTKKETLILVKKNLLLEKYFSGIKNMIKIPDIVIIIGQTKEINAVKECLKLDISTITIVDTNCNPTLTKYVIPANDDSISSVSLILSILSNSINKGFNKINKKVKN
uniref:Small ribosomal subunit protein uS2c n=1 Tax=Euglena hiemalis TaxID=392896 RepID=A0A345UC33_9EUGL|nr:ribosomal protein S2 [Euglena hiemalis]AXI98019.1 ribosomal protein S2 [Euglena hiemalis]